MSEPILTDLSQVTRWLYNPRATCQDVEATDVLVSKELFGGRKLRFAGLRSVECEVSDENDYRTLIVCTARLFPLMLVEAGNHDSKFDCLWSWSVATYKKSVAELVSDQFA